MSNNTIGQFAKIGGVGVETIRFYQRQGLLNIPNPVDGGIRHYGESDIRRLQFIIAAKKAGFSLKEIKELLDINAKNDREQVRVLAKKRIVLLDKKIAELHVARSALDRLLRECEKTMTDECPILRAFEHK
jgi:MerR family mercuric resistance operon transcriptional regulator